MLDFILVRALFILILGFCATYFRPAGEPLWSAALLGILIGGIALLVERRIARATFQRLLGATTGLIAGLICAVLINLVLNDAGGTSSSMHFAEIASLLTFSFLGAILGAAKGDLLNLTGLGVFGADVPSGTDRKILDTSVIIDGRIADIAETGFLDGVLVVPQFVLQELQTVADSSDSMRRTRGRRGLDILQRIQKMPKLKVQIVAEDFPQVREVDMKLIELARLFNCKIITNDFNLNKVAHLRGVEVLNINELTNSLKPIVLPGELMRVFILKEGKEYNQGVAYLDDGTMVVVDNARRMISKTIDISVTSVLQTTAGKMIFGKFDERTQSVAVGSAPAASAGSPVQERREAPRRDQAVGE
ncbi:MAG TPA: PIN domain-containing protein [Bryobacteraceae bacterium]|nr:PIN domain-containing protein [Bryobacteraceae bacterium]